MGNILGLYLHIPFCLAKCKYCDFLSFTDSAIIEEYAKALVVEIKGHGRLINDMDADGGVNGGHVVKTVFFGGGTPSVIRPELLVALLEAVYGAFEVDKGAEITVECNPGTVDRAKLKAYSDEGVNRLSFGLQSTDDDELRMLGRVHTYEEFYGNYSMARDIGFNNVNIDLMSSLPGQTIKRYEQTLLQVTSLKPEHLSAYGLSIEEGTPFHDLYAPGKGTSRHLVPSEEDDRRMYRLTKDILEGGGYDRYEISNYALKGYECRHNVSYWERTEYIGLGLGASTFLAGERYSNTTDMVKYVGILKEQDAATAIDGLKKDIIKLATKDAMEEYIFLGLRMTKGITRSQFLEQFDLRVDDIYGSKINKLVKTGHMAMDGDRIYLTDMGIDVSNMVLSDFLL